MKNTKTKLACIVLSTNFFIPQGTNAVWTYKSLDEMEILAEDSNFENSDEFKELSVNTIINPAQGFQLRIYNLALLLKKYNSFIEFIDFFKSEIVKKYTDKKTDSTIIESTSKCTRETKDIDSYELLTTVLSGPYKETFPYLVYESLKKDDFFLKKNLLAEKIWNKWLEYLSGSVFKKDLTNSIRDHSDKQVSAKYTSDHSKGLCLIEITDYYRFYTLKSIKEILLKFKNSPDVFTEAKQNFLNLPEENFKYIGLNIFKNENNTKTFDFNVIDELDKKIIEYQRACLNHPEYGEMLKTIMKKDCIIKSDSKMVDQATKETICDMIKNSTEKQESTALNMGLQSENQQSSRNKIKEIENQSDIQKTGKTKFQKNKKTINSSNNQSKKKTCKDKDKLVKKNYNDTAKKKALDKAITNIDNKISEIKQNTKISIETEFLTLYESIEMFIKYQQKNIQKLTPVQISLLNKIEEKSKEIYDTKTNLKSVLDETIKTLRGSIIEDLKNCSTATEIQSEEIKMDLPEKIESILDERINRPTEELFELLRLYVQTIQLNENTQEEYIEELFKAVFQLETLSSEYQLSLVGNFTYLMNKINQFVNAEPKEPLIEQELLKISEQVLECCTELCEKSKKISIVHMCCNFRKDCNTVQDINEKFNYAKNHFFFGGHVLELLTKIKNLLEKYGPTIVLNSEREQLRTEIIELLSSLINSNKNQKNLNQSSVLYDFFNNFFVLVNNDIKKFDEMVDDFELSTKNSKDESVDKIIFVFKTISANIVEIRNECVRDVNKNSNLGKDYIAKKLANYIGYTKCVFEYTNKKINEILTLNDEKIRSQLSYIIEVMNTLPDNWDRCLQEVCKN